MTAEPLKPNQTTWIFSKVQQLVDKYMPKIPFNQATWNCLIRDGNNLAEKSKHPNGEQDALCQKLVFAMIEYFDEVHKEIDRNERSMQELPK